MIPLKTTAWEASVAGARKGGRRAIGRAESEGEGPIHLLPCLSQRLLNSAKDDRSLLVLEVVVR